jgi:2-(1,2-epoxy-1,2-dihydrophenyl)acetyl-CoA isomerase
MLQIQNDTLFDKYQSSFVSIAEVHCFPFFRSAGLEYQNIRVESQDGVVRVTLNRPDKMNSFNAAMHAELRDALDAIQADATSRVLVLTGAGKGFCAGQDLADADVRFVPGQTPPDLGDVVERQYKPLVMRLAQLRVPTIAAVNVVAAGAGASLALACDMVIATQSASFILPFAKIGLIPDTACSWLVPQRLGHARAMGLAMTGQKLAAEKAAQWGLIWDCVADADFATAVNDMAKGLAAMPTKALVRTRAAMLAAHTHSRSSSSRMRR